MPLLCAADNAFGAADRGLPPNEHADILEEGRRVLALARSAPVLRAKMVLKQSAATAGEPAAAVVFLEAELAQVTAVWAVPQGPALLPAFLTALVFSSALPPLDW